MRVGITAEQFKEVLAALAPDREIVVEDVVGGPRGGKAGPVGSQGKKKKVRRSQKKKAVKPNGKTVMEDALSRLDEEDESSSFERMSAFDRLGDPKSKKPRTSAFERLQDTRSARKGDLRDTLKEKRGESTATSKIGSEERRKAVEDKEAAELWRMYERLEKRLDAQNPYRHAVFSEVTPFSRRIMSCPLPDSFKTPQIKSYNGTTDPQDHLARFGANVVMKHDGPPKCYGCGEIGHIKPRCPKAKHGKDKPCFKKQRAYISWGGDSGDESTDQEEDEAANLCLMAHEDQSDDVQEAATSGKSKSKSRAPTSSSEERLYYGDGTYLWFDSEEERTRFLTFFSKRVVAPPRIIPEHYPELQGYDDLDAQLHQAGLWPFVSRARKEINPALIRAFYSNLWREDDVLYLLVKSTPIELTVEQLGRIASLPFQGDDVSHYGGEHWVLNNEGLILNELDITELKRHASGRPTIHFANPEGRLLLYIVSRIIKPRKHGHTIMHGEDLKLIHAIMHSAPINWAKFVMINMTIAASTEHDHLLPYPFLVMDILERFKVTTTVGPLTKATKIWTNSNQTFIKRSDNAATATAAPRRTATTAGPAEPLAQANLGSIADSLNRLHLKVDGMGSYLERLDVAVQRQGYPMNAYFQGINYVPPPYHGTFLGQVYGDEDEADDSYAPSSSPDEEEFDDAIDGDEMDVDDDEEETEDED
ncbi:unnamed protein product [Cuscuta campestris]|uniref:CCHC-type domain-containing protein n=1 Tax=Cuscuta campestris TaxID=132261 RepID=A0A484LBR7_9ASTE|nr:unnamed protein product [Cuscuta campestris]